MKLLVVISSYRVTHLTIDCLRSISKEITSVPDTHVAVCENGTGDNSAERIEKIIADSRWNRWCSLTVLSVNQGFTGGNNVIIRRALQSEDPPEYVMLLNADTIVLPNAFKALIDFLDDHPEVGIAGSSQEYQDGTPHRSAFKFHTAVTEFERNLKIGLVSKLLNSKALSQLDQMCQIDWISGASMVIRRQVFEDIGLLDEGYYTHFEDIDFCFNAREAGWPTWYVPASHIIHLGGQTTGLTIKHPSRRPEYYFEARRRYFLKNHGPAYAAMADACLIIGLALCRLRMIVTGREDLTTPPYFLRDSVRNSVFVTGFKLREVQNPALIQRDKST